MESDRDPINNNEFLLQHICDVAQTLGRDTERIRYACINIFTCALQDAQRRTSFSQNNVVRRDENEIELYIRQMEHDGIFALIFEIFGEDHERLESFWATVKTSRLNFYLLRDVVEDVSDGIINIPKRYIGDTEKLIQSAQIHEQQKDISMKERLVKINSFIQLDRELQAWTKEMITSGETSLRNGKKISRKGLKWSTRFLLFGSQRRTDTFFKRAREVLLT